MLNQLPTGPSCQEEPVRSATPGEAAVRQQIPCSEAAACRIGAGVSRGTSRRTVSLICVGCPTGACQLRVLAIVGAREQYPVNGI